MLEIDGAELSAHPDLLRQMFEMIVGHVERHQARQLAYRGWQISGTKFLFVFTKTIKKIT